MDQEPDIVRATDPVVPVIIVQRPVSVQPVIIREPAQPKTPTLPGGQELAPIIPTLIEAAKIFIRSGLPLSEPFSESDEDTPDSKLKDFDDPTQASKVPMPTSKKDFKIEEQSKKDFDPTPIIEDEDEVPEFDREGDVGRWRHDWQVAELVIYREEFGKWPEDVPVETGLRSYYELRYFDEGTNRKGEKYSELYAKHRAKRALWVGQYRAGERGSEADLDTPTTESNVVYLPNRRASGSH